MGLFDAGTREGRPHTEYDRVLTVPNLISLLRLLGLPVFVWLIVIGAYGRAFAVLAGIAATDWVDGYVARRFDQMSRIGKVADPVIDRLLLATAAVTLLVIGFIPWWVVALVVGRDIALFALYAVLFKGAPPFGVSRTGKFATACLLVGVPAFLLANMDWPGVDVANVLAWLFTAAGLVAYAIAGFRYVQAALVVRRAPSHE